MIAPKHPNRNLVDECDLDYLSFCLEDDVVRAEGCGSLYRQVESGWCELDSTTSVCCALSESDCCELNVMLVAVAAVAVVILVVACNLVAVAVVAYDATRLKLRQKANKIKHSSDLRNEYRVDDSAMVKKGILHPRGKNGYSV